MVTVYLYYFFLLCMLSLGRAFAVLSVGNIGAIPVFTTDLFLLLTLPSLWTKRKAVLGLPRVYLVSIALLFAMGFVYMFIGLLQGIFFALRDVAIFLYILFSLITFIVLNGKKRIQLFLAILLLGNAISLFVGRLLLLDVYPSDGCYQVITVIKRFNLAVYYGITVAFLVPLWDSIRSKVIKSAVVLLIVCNAYMIMILNVRTLWVAVMVLIVYFLFILRKKFVKLMGYVFITFLLFTAVFGYLDSMVCKSPELEKAILRFKSVIIFLEYPNKPFREIAKSDVSISPETITNGTANGNNLQGLSKNESMYVIKRGRANIMWRIKVWRQIISFGLKSPFFGRGFGVYPTFKLRGYSPPEEIGVNSRIIPAHNHILTIFSKMGLIGLAVFMVISIYTFVYGLRNMQHCTTDLTRNLLVGAMGALLLWHISALFFDVIDSPPTSIFLWILTGLVYSVVSIDKKAVSGEGANFK